MPSVRQTSVDYASRCGCYCVRRIVFNWWRLHVVIKSTIVIVTTLLLSLRLRCETTQTLYCYCECSIVSRQPDMSELGRPRSLLRYFLPFTRFFTVYRLPVPH